MENRLIEHIIGPDCLVSVALHSGFNYLVNIRFYSSFDQMLKPRFLQLQLIELTLDNFYLPSTLPLFARYLPNIS